MTVLSAQGVERLPIALRTFPVTWFSTVMGLAGLTLAWQQLEGVLAWGQGPSPYLRVATTVMFTVLGVLYIAKAVRHPCAVRREIGHPVVLHLFATITISLILLGIAYLPDAPGLSLVLWASGTGSHILLTLYVMGVWLNDARFSIEHLNPAWFMPAVGNILVPVAGAHLGYTELAWFCFSIGLVFWFALFTIVLYRIIFHEPIPARLIPTMFILIAPPSVGMIAYLALTGELDAFARILYHIALFFGLLLFTQLPRYSRLPFSLSWWAYSFPVAALTVAGLRYHQLTDEPFALVLSVGLCLVLSVLVSALCVRTALAVRRAEPSVAGS